MTEKIIAATDEPDEAPVKWPLILEKHWCGGENCIVIIDSLRDTILEHHGSCMRHDKVCSTKKIKYLLSKSYSDHLKLKEQEAKIAELEGKVKELSVAAGALVLLVEEYEAKTCKVIRAAITIGKDDWKAEAKERELAMHKMFDFLDTVRSKLRSAGEGV